MQMVLPYEDSSYDVSSSALVVIMSGGSWVGLKIRVVKAMFSAIFQEGGLRPAFGNLLRINVYKGPCEGIGWFLSNYSDE